MSKLRQLSQRGDTIVEVLIAITIVSMVLGGAYASTNRSLNGSRASQERIEAVKYAETQVELLKAAGTDVYSGVDLFCLDDGRVKKPLGTATIPDDPNLDDFSLYQTCLRGTDNRYHISILRKVGYFEIRSRWDSPTGNGRDQVRLIYRVYQQ